MIIIAKKRSLKNKYISNFNWVTEMAIWCQRIYLDIQTFDENHKVKFWCVANQLKILLGIQ